MIDLPIVYENSKAFCCSLKRDSQKGGSFVDIFNTSSITQFPLIGILLGLLGAWMITFFILALRSGSQHPVEPQEGQVRAAIQTRTVSDASIVYKDAEEKQYTFYENENYRDAENPEIAQVAG